MPELPEVQVMRSYFEEVALNKEVKDVGFHDSLNKVFKSAKSVISKNMLGARITETNRLGKYLFARLSSGKWLHLHFGMTGSLEVFRSEEMPRFTRFVIEFTDGDKLAFKDSRKFGVVQIIDDPAAFQQNQKIADDLLEISLDKFKLGLKRRSIAVKAALLDQKLVAGIGNWIADEMLFNCGIHPEKSCKNLTANEIESLLESGQSIAKEAIAADTHYGDFPKHFFVNYRKAGAIHPDHPHSPVEGMRVGGRGTFIVPEKQRL